LPWQGESPTASVVFTKVRTLNAFSLVRAESLVGAAHAVAILETLPLLELPGIGRKLGYALREMGITTAGELQKIPLVYRLHVGC
jgi:hypothetical protein